MASLLAEFSSPLLLCRAIGPFEQAQQPGNHASVQIAPIVGSDQNQDGPASLRHLKTSKQDIDVSIGVGATPAKLWSWCLVSGGWPGQSCAFAQREVAVIALAEALNGAKAMPHEA